jgi:hypothetical protein
MRIVAIVVGLIVGFGACRQQEAPTQAKADRAQVASRAEPPEIGYPEGPWWDGDIQQLMLAGSQILISHRDAKPIHRLIVAGAKDRSREEARQLAWALYLELRSNPSRFAEVAARESDEPITRAFGGELGVFYAETVPPAFVDAFGYAGEGEATRPVETEQGFHVLRRVKPPAAPTKLDLSHIVIKFDGMSGWWRPDRAVVARSREEARALAERVAREAQQAPDQFGKLALEYSDADDALREGDMGALSTYDMIESDARLFAVAERLPLGAVSDVIALENTGLHIVRRAPPAERPVYAASVITIGYADSPLSQLKPNATRTRAEAEQLARRIAAQLKRRPDSFDALRQKLCDAVLCEGVLSWSKGRGLVALERETVRLRVDQISDKPVASPLGLLIVRREDGERHPPPPTPTPVFTFPLGRVWDEGTASANGP